MGDKIIQIQATQGVCADFMGDSKEKGEVSIVIAPIKVLEENGKIVIINGCSMYLNCHNPDCWYSIATRLKSRETRAAKIGAEKKSPATSG